MISLFNILKAILIGFSTGFIASIPLGPSGLESVSRSISKGFREGFKVSLGAVSADITYIIIINLGLFTILTKNPKFHSLFWIVSGFVLILSNKISSRAKNSNSKLDISLSKYASSGFLTGFLITFLNPTTPSLWIALSGTIFNVWRHHGRTFFFFSISSMIVGSITWFCFLNILVSKGFKKLNPNFTNNTSKILDYFLLALGIIFIIWGIYKFIF
ncbi:MULTISPECIES: LysE family transporter [unclassified Clostridium]|uniref:LysE family translocator n=1 Tax=unclassified Clostridium TaxID=2614128 RepID=UPI0002977E19|nr:MULTISPECIES: LysE family transporter [unclassified Clostridium]EKQ57770.1 MAG: putative threonine efflux protein [Clostridium sp. Maddingley MBC34-26]